MLAKPVGALFAVVLLTQPTSAQSVPIAGRTIEAETGAAVVGATVYLLDSTAVGVTVTLSDSLGAFSFSAPGPGSYGFRVERIGFEATQLEQVDVPSVGVDKLALALHIRPIVLEEISVSGERLCEDGGSGRALAAVWSEAQKALVATLVSGVESDVEFTIEVSHRELNRRREVSSEVVDTVTTTASRGFQFAPVARLNEAGWGEVEGERIEWFYGPSPNALLSDWFVRHHCLSFVSTPTDSLVGLAFESPEQSLEIGMQGVFWVERETWLLRRIEFKYLGDLPGGVSDEWDGEVDLRVDRAGRWFVSEWRIRRPVARPGITIINELARGGRTAAAPRFTGYSERAGRVLARSGYDQLTIRAVATPDELQLRAVVTPNRVRNVTPDPLDAGTGDPAERGRLVVKVVDETSGAAVEGALLEIPRFNLAGISNSEGRIEIADVSLDTMTVHISHLAYRTVSGSISLKGSTRLEVRFVPGVIELEGIEVSAARDRLERRRMAYGRVGSFSFDGVDLNTIADLSAQVAARAGAPLVTCEDRLHPDEIVNETSCMRFRGQAVPTCAVLNEAKLAGGVKALDLLLPDQIERIEVYPSNGAMRVYTRRFLERAMERPFLVRPAFVDPCS